MGINTSKFNKYTIDILNKLPFWFDIKKNHKESLGAKFLNVFGLELEEFESIMEYAYEMCELDTIKNKTYVCYKTKYTDDIKCVTSGGVECKLINSEKEFINNIDTLCYYLDKEYKILYISSNVNILVNGKDVSNLATQFIWLANILDEYGLLLDLPRLENEKNIDYKKRLLSYEIYKPSSNEAGIYNLLAHGLGLVRTTSWNNGQEDIVLKDKDICAHNIYVDGKPFSKCKLVSDGVVLYGDELYLNIPREITYYVGIQILNLSEYEHNSLYQELYTTNNTAKEKLLEYNNYIMTTCPILWGSSRWDDGYWLKEYENYIFIPNTFDQILKY